MFVRVCVYVCVYLRMQNELVSLQSENSSLNGKLTKLGQVCQVSRTALSLWYLPAGWPVSQLVPSSRPSEAEKGALFLCHWQDQRRHRSRQISSTALSGMYVRIYVPCKPVCHCIHTYMYIRVICRCGLLACTLGCVRAYTCTYVCMCNYVCKYCVRIYYTYLVMQVCPLECYCENAADITDIQQWCCISAF